MAFKKVQSQEEFIEIYGARVHNLKNVNLKIPRNKLVEKLARGL